MADHVDHICQLGGAGMVGFGSDFDGIDIYPQGLRHPGDLPGLAQALSRRGYAQEALAGILGKNLLAYYRRIAP